MSQDVVRGAIKMQKYQKASFCQEMEVLPQFYLLANASANIDLSSAKPIALL